MTPGLWTPEIIRPPLPVIDGALRRQRDKERERWRHIRDPRVEWQIERRCAITLVTSSSGAAASSSGCSASASVNTSGSNLFVGGTSWLNGSTAPTIADSKGNTGWIYLTSVANGSLRTALFYCINPSSVGSGHTFAATGSSVYSPVAVLAFAGADTGTGYDGVEATGATSGTTVHPGPVTPTQANCVVVTCLGYDTAGEPISIDAGFTKQEAQAYIAGTSFGLGLAFFIQGSAAALDPIWTRTNSNSLAGGIAPFRAAAGGGGSRGLFMAPPLGGLGVGGSFFRDPLQGKAA